MNTKTFGTWSTKEISSRERETEATHQKVTDWVGGREKETQQKSERKREREKRTNQVSRSQIGRS